MHHWWWWSHRHDNSRELYTCGWNNRGQLGLGDTINRIELHRVLIPPVKHVSCGWNHTLAITDTGHLLVFGSNAFGQLGIGRIGWQCTTPTSCEVSPGSCVTDVAAGLRHSVAVLADGSVWSWGDNKKGQLGCSRERSKKCIPFPVQVSFEGCRGKSIAVGLHHTVLLTDAGAVYCWGSNQHGQCGASLLQVIQKNPTDISTNSDPTSNTESKEPAMKLKIESVPVPMRVRGPLNDACVREIHSGWSHVVVATDQGRVYTWGRADYGQLGGGDELQQNGHSAEPREVKCLRGVKQLACGAEHSIAISGDGQVRTWGWNEHGMCGTGDESNVLSPVLVSAVQRSLVMLVGCGSGHSFAVVKTRLMQDFRDDEKN
ncbi:secretion-regulating guanine nucleotide exchange factor isoform X2 [Nematostella vectensis]|uniref:secretion-regulating guanine nucleotide exchange factor isoform X2 n=1 Tax=Nematostella vectensis TaxID=45351 RepID=UPI00138FC5E8|nr:secretion-regulating guanine nucleotide exchange factor isoform X2 [Nematostella vectensis]